MARCLPFQYREASEITADSPTLVRRVVVKLEDGWRAEAELGIRGGKAEIMSILVLHSRGTAGVPLGGLAKATLEAIPFRAIREYGHAWAKEASEDPIALVPSLLDTPLAARPARPGPTRRALSVADARLAEMYVAECAAGGQRGIHERLAAQLPDGYDRNYVRKRIERSRGTLLTRPGRGAAGGELTETAKKLLDIETGQVL